ncbi:MAG TPA: hypothetical protein VGR54_02835 [Nitrosopumilaceae archaeon]|nr:hypothetical protein [Nitrosopumilaceae archaeon]
MKKTSYETQKLVKAYNRNKIIAALDGDPKRFKDLLDSTKLSAMGLTNIIKQLVSEKIIEHVIHNGKQSYSLSKSGIEQLLELKKAGYTLKKIQDEGGRYYEDYSGYYNSKYYNDLPWGIEDELMVDKRIDQKINPITKEVVADMQELLYTKVKELIKKGKITIDKFTNGDILLSFMIEYKELINSIQENSLEYIKNITNEELDLRDKIENGAITKKEMELLQKIREKTKQRIKEMNKK